VFITSGDRNFLAFQNRNNPLLVGQSLLFRIDGQRAVDIEVITQEQQQ
jgi:hypothetical protein